MRAGRIDLKKKTTSQTSYSNKIQTTDREEIISSYQQRGRQCYSSGDGISGMKEYQIPHLTQLNYIYLQNDGSSHSF